MPIYRPAPNSPQALARALAIVLVADNLIDERELEVLDRLDTFRRIGLPRNAFLTIAELEHGRLRGRFADKPWLSLDDLQILDDALGAVDDAAARLLVCRLAAGVMTADGCVREAERLVFDHMLMRWRINRQQVSDAIRTDPQVAPA
jgi:hypothetical protein